MGKHDYIVLEIKNLLDKLLQIKSQSASLYNEISKICNAAIALIKSYENRISYDYDVCISTLESVLNSLHNYTDVDEALNRAILKTKISLKLFLYKHNLELERLHSRKAYLG